MSVFFGASGIGQTLSGFLVDRVGAHRVLLGGMALFAGSIALAGLVPSYWLLLPVALLAGLGNSVFHPADYSILNAPVDPRRIGRGYSVHAISGNLGWAVAPTVVFGLTAHFGWRAALVTVGGLGLAMVAVLATPAAAPSWAAAAAAREARRATEVRLLLTAPILSAFAYFALIATALIGVQTFGVTTLMRVYDTPLALATAALTAFLLGGAAGILAGGLLADRTQPARRRGGGGAGRGRGVHDAAGHRRAGAALLPIVLGVTGFCHGRHRALARHAGARGHAARRLRQGVRLRLLGARPGLLPHPARLRLAPRPRRPAHALRRGRHPDALHHRHRRPGPPQRAARVARPAPVASREAGWAPGWPPVPGCVTRSPDRRSRAAAGSGGPLRPDEATRAHPAPRTGRSRAGDALSTTLRRGWLARKRRQLSRRISQRRSSR